MYDQKKPKITIHMDNAFTITMWHVPFTLCWRIGQNLWKHLHKTRLILGRINTHLSPTNTITYPSPYFCLKLGIIRLILKLEENVTRIGYILYQYFTFHSLLLVNELWKCTQNITTSCIYGQIETVVKHKRSNLSKKKRCNMNTSVYFQTVGFYLTRFSLAWHNVDNAWKLGSPWHPFNITL